jgi:glycyl-tRNA synthetase
MANLMDKIVSLCKRRGFVFPGSEIYGGLSGFYDYGPLGAMLIDNIKKEWRAAVRRHDNIFEIDSSIIMERRVWEASGHTSAGFTDPLRECKKCHRRFRADHVPGPNRDKCPECGGQLMEPRQFNLLVETHIGPVEDDSSLTYLRGETTQGIYVNYKNVKDSMGVELPFGIAQTGKAFRNEITPRHFIFRMREFEQMEQQYFVRPEEAEKYFEFWKKERMKWYLELGVRRKNLRFRPHEKKELAHYARAAEDIEYNFPFGWNEIEGIHNRGDWDLSRHSQFSGQDLSETDEKTGKKFYPYIVETSAGADRSMLAFLAEAYDDSDKERFVLKLHPKLAPYKAAVFPLLANKPKLVSLARKIYVDLRKEFFVAWDDRGNIGKRYYSQDEIATVATVTVDFQTLDDYTVTLRDRDTAKQVRLPIKDLQETIQKVVEGRSLLKFGKIVR